MYAVEAEVLATGLHILNIRDILVDQNYFPMHTGEAWGRLRRTR